MAPQSRRVRWTGLAATALSSTLGCGEPDASITGTYIAQIDETLIAIVVDDPNGPAVAYACDGRDGVVDPASGWFNGTLADGTAELTGPEGTLLVTVADAEASGELRFKGTAARAFDGPRSADGVLLWATTPPDMGDYLGGWIFADDGTQRGAVLKRSVGDTSVTLSSPQTTTLVHEGTSLSIMTVSAPKSIE